MTENKIEKSIEREHPKVDDYAEELLEKDDDGNYKYDKVVLETPSGKTFEFAVENRERFRRAHDPDYRRNGN